MSPSPDEVESPIYPGTQLPAGPPLHLERPGQITHHLAPFMLPKRLERLGQVLARRTRRLTALLESVHDPHNISACIRSCDAFGIQDLHIVPSEGEPLTVSRGVGTGAHRWLTLHVHDDIESALLALREAGYLIAATTVSASSTPVALEEIGMHRPLCLAFGNEHAGVSARLQEEADLEVHIPTIGFVESLNVSVAFAICLHDMRQRLDANPREDWGLSEEEQVSLLDRWVAADVARSEAILEELARRQS